MTEERKIAEVFYCRHGMHRSGPYSRRTIRHLLQAGLIDAQTLISVGDLRQMQPLGASPAAQEITWVSRRWARGYSLIIYAAWLVFIPLFTSGIAGMAIMHCKDVLLLLPAAMILGNLGMSIWLFRTWKILLAEEPNSICKAALYAFPMTLPLLNFIWIWIGYMQLPKYWRKFKKIHNIPDNSPYKLYYLVVILFYLQGIPTLHVLSGQCQNLLEVQIIGIINWIWYGLVLLSLFLTDRFAMLMVKDKLRNLAFGAVRFCADINYDVMHRAVLLLALRARKSCFYFLLALLVSSWMIGGWFWMKALEIGFMEYNNQTINCWSQCPFCK
ncbi:MAG: hypothetical protein E7052_00460 [Lentisphaerae bacterium]|nr:hypothetical protein [Lentisphaerota bacterium]